MFNKISKTNQTQNKSEDVQIKFGTENAKLGKHAFVLKLEDTDNKLKILISGSAVGEKNSNIDEKLDKNLKNLLSNSRPVYPNKSELYEITFPNYIIYQVRNESYCSYDDYDIRKGKHLIIFEKSRLLDYFLTVTDCVNFFPGESKHFGVYSENHIIDIIAFDEPDIRKI